MKKTKQRPAPLPGPRQAMREKPMVATVYFLLRFSVILVMVAQFFNKNFENVFLCILTLILLLLPAMLELLQRKRFGEYRVFSELDLSKHDIPLVLRDNIYLTGAAGKVHFPYRIAFFLQIFRRLPLAEAAESAYVHQCIFLKKLILCIGDGPNSRIAS